VKPNDLWPRCDVIEVAPNRIPNTFLESFKSIGIRKNGMTQCTSRESTFNIMLDKKDNL